MKCSILVLFPLYAIVNAKLPFASRGNAVWGRRRVVLVDTRHDNNDDKHGSLFGRLSMRTRGGYQNENDSTSATTEEELSLDEKVQAAMKKLGLSVEPSVEDDDNDSDAVCQEGGACPIPTTTTTTTATAITADRTTTSQQEERIPESQLWTTAAEIAKSMQVDESLAMAALGATSSSVAANDSNQRTYSAVAARAMIQQELDMIATIPEDSDAVQQLVAQGHDDVFLVRRALAFAEGNLDDAKAILEADAQDLQQAQEEEEAQEAARQQKQQQQAEQQPPPNPSKQEEFKTVTVNSNFDPTKVSAGGAAATSNPSPPASTTPPKPAKKSDVVFEATTAQIQELVLESPVPVLLDVYADWCGPCKVLGPILEDMAVKSGGMFRLVKINSDNERPVSAALGVSALPTVFGLRSGKIVHMFKGMPRSEESMKNFLMGLLVPGATFTPPVSDSEQESYNEMTGKLVKMAGAACFSFSARERLQDRIATFLDNLVQETGDASQAEESALVVRSLLSNVIKNPYEPKFRSANLVNKKIAAKITSFPSALAMLKSVGFVKSDDGNSMTLGKSKKLVNVAPLMVARDSIDKWIDQSRYEIARAVRKRKDEEDRARLEAAGHFDKDEEEEEQVEEKVVDMDSCQLKVRLEGKRKVLEMSFAADDPVRSILNKLPSTPTSDDNEVKITCASKRLVLKSNNEGAFEKTFRELGLSPAAAVVVSVGGSKAQESSNSKLSERASQKKRKKGSHTMQSVGIYSKDDNAKAELIDGGGGVWYEHDVTDDEEQEEEDEAKEDETSDKASEEERETGDE